MIVNLDWLFMLEVSPVLFSFLGVGVMIGRGVEHEPLELELVQYVAPVNVEKLIRDARREIQFIRIVKKAEQPEIDQAVEKMLEIRRKYNFWDLVDGH